MDESEGRTLTRKVLVELAVQWRAIWQRAQDFQNENPGVKQVALQGTPDPVASIEGLLPNLAYLHPQNVAALLAFLDAVIGELGDCVPPPQYPPERVGELVFAGDGDGDVEDVVGGGQLHDRVARLEDEIVELTGLLRSVLELYEEADSPGSAQPSNGSERSRVRGD